ncbi:MAG: cyclic nucleotide-binding domain-containing protein [Deltaproteobacteria bacterium]|nr:MAG: cyclic nucleotide-binding domain-containing protein [Deltaproteobacteria bacterium]
MAVDVDNRPVPSAALEEPLTLFREGKLDLGTLAEVLVRFGRADHGEAPRATMAGVLARTLRHTAPTSAPQTRQLRARPRPRSEPLQAVDLTSLDRFTAAAGVAATVGIGLGPDCPLPDGPGDARHAFGHPLGQGGVGVVRLAVDRDLRRAVAVKALRDEHREDPVLIQAFLEEAIITGGLEHPNIVPIHEVGVSTELGPYYTMKRLEGEPLSELLSRLRHADEPGSGPARLGRYVEFFAQTLRAVAYAHDRGVIHCDLKPANIIVGRYGDVTVIDWGLAKLAGAAGRDQARARLWSGSPGYMSPEQALSHDIDALDARTDIWSLGAILYEILTLTLPFAEPDGSLPENIHWRPIPPPLERAPDRPIPPELDRLAMRMLSRAPEDRPERVQDVLAAIETWLDGSRERQRRQTAATHALTEASEALREARPLEEAIDALQAGPDPDASEAFAEARAALVEVYEVACDAVLTGLELNPDGASLQRAAAALFWYTFERLHPGRVATDGSARRRAIALLDRLSPVALDAIIARGHQKGVPAADIADQLHGVDDPWIVAATCFTARAGPNPLAEELLARVRVLQRAAIFGGTPGHELLAVADACEHVTFAADDIIFTVGDPGDAFYVVLDGTVEIVREDRVLTTLGPLSCFGEVALVDGSTRTAAARARGPATCLALTGDRFQAILRSHGAIGLRVMRVLAERLRDATEREITQLAARSIP